ncbi:DEAD/DEAH box helicase [Listeria monocytogenes]|uniref:DEAD/DEAH box helicase n=1 Tax=Listeria monocytogenes TaxID=1639 RepID=UPI00074D5B8F|nr:DEAD/DEAH box helicase [Listeria monocytogenes]EDN8988395.1 DEAD/DEAH box helicase family protein [Listeria monocytogenes]EDN9022402.1 DEAD/DEAH box helicase family protein [Listeria monocytogenes]EGQ7926931.1 DEAD/DEAH box helicase [Listeria monocytogenes]EGR8777234.1 DEAD/DEAH box helicase [Listeria monocytogenes]SCU59723.1 helicase competence protein [Listeria monocytogenes]
MDIFPGKLYQEREIESKEGLREVVAIESNKCFRCGNTDVQLFGKMSCALCKREDCIYCRNCIVMGRVNSCQKLYYQHARLLLETKEVLLRWEGALSAGQRKASNAIVVNLKAKTDMLLWAVAGSGKTEMMFEGMDWALRQGFRICVASPRVDVCLELLPRLKEAFPSIDIVCLYGDSKDNYQGEQFVIATTHQLIRFYEAFQVIFIDEVDAFPYAKDPFLEYAVMKARTKEGSTIIITATPEKKWQEECVRGKRNFVKIPGRYHRKKLPVPRTCWIGPWKKNLAKGKITPKLIQWMNDVKKKDQPALIFFPEIDAMNKFANALENKGYASPVTVHSADELRKEKVEWLRKGKIKLLLTTTILERGVTFTDVQVAVFGSEARIFTEAALVQISGRAGRKLSHPTGDVCFFHYGKTIEMKQAISHIQKMNQQGVIEGMLDD